MFTFTPRENFTKAMGIKIQTKQIADWGRLLKPVVLSDVKAEAQRRNENLPDEASGYDVWRGTSIETFVINWHRK